MKVMKMDGESLCSSGDVDCMQDGTSRIYDRIRCTSGYKLTILQVLFSLVGEL